MSYQFLTVERRGEFSVRGGIVDIFPLDTEHGLRVDLFGTEIESIRRFDVHTQRSLRKLGEVESVTILPASTRVLWQAALQQDASPASGHLVPLVDLLPADAVVVFDTPETYALLADRFHQVVERRFHERASQQSLPPPSLLYVTLPDFLTASLRLRTIHHSVVEESSGAD